MKVEAALHEFQKNMLAKLKEVDHKHGDHSAMRIESGATMDQMSLLRHLRQEVSEWACQVDDQSEMIDVANRFFLLWWNQEDSRLQGQ